MAQHGLIMPLMTGLADSRLQHKPTALQSDTGKKGALYKPLQPGVSVSIHRLTVRLLRQT